MNTVADTAKTLRESLTVADALRRFAPQVRLHKNGVERCGACPKCGDGGKGEASDRFYITVDGKACACRKCHTQRMDVAGMVAWLLGVPMHEALDVLNGHTQAPSVVTHNVHSEVSPVTDTDSQTSDWRALAAQRSQQAHERLLGDTETAAAARSYLTSRGLTQDTWHAFTLGYERAKVPQSTVWSPAICWPVTHEVTGETVGMRYRFLETQHVQVNGKDKDVRYTSLHGSRTSGRLFGTKLLCDTVARYRCLVITEGEFNAMSVWQACNVAGVDVLSFGSESQRILPAWAVQVASHYGSVVTWLDDADKARQVSAQLSQAATLRSIHNEDGKEDANVLLLAGTLGGLVQTARLHAVKTEQRESVLWDLWDAWRAGELDAGQVQVGKQLAQALGKCEQLFSLTH